MLNRFQQYLQTIGIQVHAHNYVYNPQQPLYLHGGNINIPIVQSRDILDNSTYKFAEKITFNNGGDYAVAIGYNPALNNGAYIDRTNYLVANLLRNLKYDGYYLFNMLPDVSGTKIAKATSSYPNYIKTVLDFLMQDNSTWNCDIFIFWGSSVYVKNNIINGILGLKNQHVNTIGTTSKQHKHPGRGVSLQTISSFPVNLSQLARGVHYLK